MPNLKKKYDTLFASPKYGVIYIASSYIVQIWLRALIWHHLLMPSFLAFLQATRNFLLYLHVRSLNNWPAVCTHSYRQYVRIMRVVSGHTPLLLGIWPRIKSCTLLNLALLAFLVCVSYFNPSVLISLFLSLPLWGAWVGREVERGPSHHI